MKLLFVCLENVCRSPMARAVALKLANERGLRLVADSAGLRPTWLRAGIDPRAQDALQRAGIDVPRHTARAVTVKDFSRHDHVVAMDRQVLRGLRALAGAAQGEGGMGGPRLTLLMDWSEDRPGEDVPDPYFGPAAGFDEVLRLCLSGTRGLLERAFQGLPPPSAGGEAPGAPFVTS